jgi:quercetin dioxygenase-like cupin family protein
MIARSLALAAALAIGTVPAFAADTDAVVAPQFAHALPNAPGKSMRVVTVSYPPGGTTPGHRHGQAFVYAYVLSGHVRTQVEGEPEKIVGPGDGWYEMPGAHHMVSSNASKTEPAKFLVVFIAGDKDELVTMDK